MAARKRRRTAVNVVRAARRPISKSLIIIKQAGIAAAQVSTELFVTTFPATMVGLRWSLSAFESAGGTGATQLQWAIVISRDGNTANTMSTGDGNTFYNPEADVLAFGCANSLKHTDAGYTSNHVWNGETKTMRKLKTGDRLDLIAISEAVQVWDMFGCVQFFVKA